MKTFLKYFILLTCCSIANAQQKSMNLNGPYLGQNPPGTTPEIFAPGIISTDAHEFSCCFSPDGNEFYFARMNAEEHQNYVMYTRLINGVWSVPEVAPFAGPFTFEPFITPDNKRAYFQTGKVTDGQLLMYTMFAERTENGWSEAKDPGAPFNPMKTMHISSTSDGTIYTTDISGGMGSEALGIIRKEDDAYNRLERLGLPFNQTEKQQHPWIAPDESYMIFTVRRPGENPVSVLCASFRKDNKWSEPVELKLGMEAGQPFISIDSKYLFFTSMKQGKGDIYWVSAEIIKELKPKE